jgi:hypothetical protein
MIEEDRLRVAGVNHHSLVDVLGEVNQSHGVTFRMFVRTHWMSRLMLVNSPVGAPDGEPDAPRETVG